jgi:hypothetical protein
MIRIKIKKGRHYPYLIPIVFPFCVKKNKESSRIATFMFTDSCMFDLYDEDQWDVNKLFGFSIGHHQHGSSFRFGWRPILTENLIEIVAYEYHDGVRMKTMPICRIKLNKWYGFRLVYLPQINKTYYYVNDIEIDILIRDREIYKLTNDVNLKKKSGLGYTLGIYFGGNEKAPQDITIYKKRILWLKKNYR